MRILVQSVSLVLLLAMTWVLVAVALQGTSVALASAGRVVFAVAGLGLLAGWTGGRARLRSPRRSAERPAEPIKWWRVAVLSLLGVSLYTVFSTAAIALAGTTVPALIMALTPAAVLLIEQVWERRWPSRVVFGGTMTAILGALVFIAQNSRVAGAPAASSFAWGIVCAAAAMISMAWYGVLFGRWNRGSRSPMVRRILPIFALGAVPLLVWAIASISAGDTLSMGALVVLVTLGVLIYVPAYLLQHSIIVRDGAIVAAVVALVVPAAVVLLSALFGLGALPNLLQWIALCVTLLGMLGVIAARSGRATPS
ncbi:DMT family transporter [Haematomicrobium sanguinis]|uniref:DMT family transporter n=1 Tax=Haematomicrobium sanguinis TaxID=479106 RepID=UPI0004789CE4|nr:DMT family transporter [Haematomicrobium sanguinis]